MVEEREEKEKQNDFEIHYLSCEEWLMSQTAIFSLCHLFPPPGSESIVPSPGYLHQSSLHEPGGVYNASATVLNKILLLDIGLVS